MWQSASTKEICGNLRESVVVSCALWWQLQRAPLGRVAEFRRYLSQSAPRGNVPRQQRRMRRPMRSNLNGHITISLI